MISLTNYITRYASHPAISERRIIEFDDVTFFGDDFTDIEMLKAAGTGVAMGNAIDELKQRATYITDDCDKDGIYNACVKFGWIK